MESYQEEISRVGEFLLKAGQSDQLSRVGDEEFDQVLRMTRYQEWRDSL